MIMAGAEKWIPLTTAAKQFGVSASKLSLMVRQGKIKEIRKDPKDERKVLLSVEELRSIFYPTEQ